jgi:hypothetical protein
MFPLSDYFFTEIRGSLACDIVYGNKVQRAKFGFLENLHTTVSEIYQTMDSHNEVTPYETFESLFKTRFGESVSSSIPFALYISWRVSQELKSSFPQSELGTLIASMRNDFPEGLQSELESIISKEFLWQTSPADYLNNYFEEEPQRAQLTFEEFLTYLGLKETHVDEVEAARLAFDQPIALLKPKNKNKSAGVVDDGMTKKQRRALKLQSRLDKNNA